MSHRRQASRETAVAWRQSLGAGLLLGLALGCAWLAHWTPQAAVRVLLIAAAVVLAAWGIVLMSAGTEGGGWRPALRRRLDERLAAAGLPFLGVLVILALAAVSSGNNLLYLIVSALLAVLIISGLASALNLSGMELRFRLPPEIYAGRPAAVEFTLTNAKGFWPAYSLIVSAGSRRVGQRGAEEIGLKPVYFAYVPPRGSIDSGSTIQFPGRGRYSATAFTLTTRFPFGLVKKRRRFQSNQREPELLVYPALAPAPALAQAALQAGARAQAQRRGDGHELYRIRPHQAGDSARQVHWKASARAGGLRVREFNTENTSRLRLRLALPPGLEAGRAEAAISLCAGWLLHLIELSNRPENGTELWLEFVGENAAGARTEGCWLPLAPAAQQRRPLLEYLAIVDAARPAPSRSEFDPGLVEVLIDGSGPPGSVMPPDLGDAAPGTAH